MSHKVGSSPWGLGSHSYLEFDLLEHADPLIAGAGDGQPGGILA